MQIVVAFSASLSSVFWSRSRDGVVQARGRLVEEVNRAALEHFCCCNSRGGTAPLAHRLFTGWGTRRARRREYPRRSRQEPGHGSSICFLSRGRFDTVQISSRLSKRTRAGSRSRGVINETRQGSRRERARALCNALAAKNRRAAVARGGRQPTAARVRVRCGTHNIVTSLVSERALEHAYSWPGEVLELQAAPGSIGAQ